MSSRTTSALGTGTASRGGGGGKDGDLSPTSHEPSSPAGSSSAAAIQQRFDWAGSSSEEHMPKLLDAHGNVTPSLTLSPFVLRQLAGAVPSRFAFADWRLLYSTAVHGISLNTLYTKCSACGCCVLAIKDDEGNVFGGFCTEWREPVAQQSFYGSGETFLWSIEKLQNLPPLPGERARTLFLSPRPLARCLLLTPRAPSSLACTHAAAPQSVRTRRLMRPCTCTAGRARTHSLCSRRATI